MTRPAGTVARQQHLLETAITVVGEAGLRGLTHRAVDRRAGLPEGTCSVYYRTRLALLSALTEHVADRLATDVDELAERLDGVGADDPEPAIKGTAELLARWSREPALIIAMTELSLEAVRTPSLREPVQRWRRRLLSIVEAIIDRSGRPQVALRAEVVVASMEGVAIAALNVPDDAVGDYLRRTIELIVRSLSAADEG